ncbi:NUDIX family hydrolase [Hyaloscypha variabilis F]|jgi:ADP-sugar diphosphatase|uniref:NUDIX family hydrolase n=1 Tax=Hyaloscypha variabilis (strain UAMH 11265 / GT02V1 / F) TaxID=1149755 RepID=A0A2J6QY75_HYAVF|nr:NUDIX family hydrolase [Hyaloscypha variabilis F]
MAFNLPGFKNPVPVNIKVGNITEGELLRFRAFNDWQKTLKASLDLQQDPDHPFHKAPYELKSIEIQSVDWFAKNTDRAFVGFVKLEADVRNEEGKSLPGIAFLRGMSVAMLMILRPSDSKTERWVIMTEQPRIPAGSLRFLEIPAGMMDDHKTFSGAAAKEIKEETGLTVHEHDLQDLTSLALKNAENLESLQYGMYPSPGGQDESIRIFLWEKVMDRQEIVGLTGRLSGKRASSEMITIRILPYEQLWEVGARDAKTLAAWSLYEALKRSRRLSNTKTW